MGRDPQEDKKVESELLIMRHARARAGSPTQRDFDRPLAPDGRLELKDMARWFSTQPEPELILASPSSRTRETVEGLPLAAPVRWEKRIYEAALPTLLDLLVETAAVRRRLLVGHNPSLEQLLAHLVTTINGVGRRHLEPAALAVLRLPAGFDYGVAGGAELIDLIRPRAITP